MPDPFVMNNPFVDIFYFTTIISDKQISIKTFLCIILTTLYVIYTIKMI